RERPGQLAARRHASRDGGGRLPHRPLRRRRRGHRGGDPERAPPGRDDDGPRRGHRLRARAGTAPRHASPLSLAPRRASAGPRFGFSISPGHPRGVADEAAYAEQLGYDRIGVWDSPALFREPWVTLAATASTTDRIALGTWVTNPVTRHPV